MTDVEKIDREVSEALAAQTKSASNRKTLGILTIAAVAMLGLGFASKPLYDTFCKITGYGGTTRVAEDNPYEVSDRVIRVQFDANTSKDLDWDFGPEKPYMDVNVGASNLAFYTATNNSDKTVVATSNYNVSPIKSGPYFSKMECFCFTEQSIEPGETVEFPVVFFLDPLLLEDKRMDEIKTVTLSYTFFPIQPGQAIKEAKLK